MRPFDALKAGQGGVRRGAVPHRAVLRRARLALRTLLGLRSGGFFIPYRHAGTLDDTGYPALAHRFTQAEPQFRALLAAIEAYREPLRRIAEKGPGLLGPRPARFDQDWFPRLDAAAAYAMIRTHAPGRIVEVGSGHSSRFMAQAIADGALPTLMTCIDPAPRAPLEGLPVRHVARLLGPADAAAAADLAPGDVLFVDSSHIGMPGTDVDRIVLDILPRLRPGVLVHVHDIFLPDAYPDDFVWRGYNEHLAVGALLVGAAFELLFSSHYVVERLGLPARDWIATQPRRPGAYESSLWLKKAA